MRPRATHHLSTNPVASRYDDLNKISLRHMNLQKCFARPQYDCAECVDWLKLLMTQIHVATDYTENKDAQAQSLL